MVLLSWQPSIIATSFIPRWSDAHTMCARYHHVIPLPDMSDDGTRLFKEIERIVKSPYPVSLKVRKETLVVE